MSCSECRKCPKCGEPNLHWVGPTKNGKKWLKKDLGEGQLSKGWHNCGLYKPENDGVQVSEKIEPERWYCQEHRRKLDSNFMCPVCDNARVRVKGICL